MTTKDDLDLYLHYVPSSYQPKGDEDTFFSEGGLNHPEPFGTRELLEMSNENWHMRHRPTDDRKPPSEHRPTTDERRLIGAISGGLTGMGRPEEPLQQGGHYVSEVREFSRPSEASDSFPYGYGPIPQKDRFRLMGMGEVDPDVVRFTEGSGDPAAEMTRVP